MKIHHSINQSINVRYFCNVVHYHSPYTHIPLLYSILLSKILITIYIILLINLHEFNRMEEKKFTITFTIFFLLNYIIVTMFVIMNKSNANLMDDYRLKIMVYVTTMKWYDLCVCVGVNEVFFISFFFILNQNGHTVNIL